MAIGKIVGRVLGLRALGERRKAGRRKWKEEMEGGNKSGTDVA